MTRTLINQQTVKESILLLKNNTTKRHQWEMITSYVQTVLLLQPHKLEVSFATLRRFCQWCWSSASSTMRSR